MWGTGSCSCLGSQPIARVVRTGQMPAACVRGIRFLCWTNHHSANIDLARSTASRSLAVTGWPVTTPSVRSSSRNHSESKVIELGVQLGSRSCRQRERGRRTADKESENPGNKESGEWELAISLLRIVFRGHMTFCHGMELPSPCQFHHLRQAS